MNGYLLDTHAWLWVMGNATDETSPRFFSDVEDWQRRGLVLLSPFSCWEIGLLVAAKKLQLDTPIELLWDIATKDEAFKVAPLTTHVLAESTRLPGNLHRDPADRILAATARVQNLTLVTRDWRLLDYAKQGHIRARKP